MYNILNMTGVKERERWWEFCAHLREVVLLGLCSNGGYRGLMPATNHFTFEKIYRQNLLSVGTL